MPIQLPPGELRIEDLPPCKGGLSRRGFCVAAGTGLVTLGLSACDPGVGRVAVGGLGTGSPGGVGGGPQNGIDGGNGSGGQDGGSTGAQDSGSTGGQDSGTTNACAGPLNAGAASALAAGQVKHFTDNVSYDLYVCRDAGGLYAIDAVCPHNGCTVNHQTSQWYCPCHGATWDLDGQHPTSPAHSALPHYAVCVDGSGSVLVDYNHTVAYTTRA